MDNRILLSPRVISRPGNTAPVSSPHPVRQPGNPGFQQILDQKNQAVKFSAHALERLSRRNIPFGEKEMNSLAEAVTKAEKKGAIDSLVVMKNVALVVSVKNRTVITAVDGANLKDNVFTKIDSAVIIPD